jgi:hypothetical protein
LSTRKLNVYASKEEFLENEVRTLSHHVQSMIDTMKVMSMNRQTMLDEIARLTAENEAGRMAEREACAQVCDEAGKRMAQRTQDMRSAALESAAESIRARSNT